MTTASSSLFSDTSTSDVQKIILLVGASYKYLREIPDAP